MLWLVGAGLMAQEYIRVLQELSVDFKCIGRGKQTAEKCKQETKQDVFVGGLEKFLSKNLDNKCSHAIIATNVESLFENCLLLLEFGVENILLEKPGALKYSEILLLQNEANKRNARVYIAYNRRFYASVLKAKDIIVRDGGVKSFCFNFTEWKHIIEKLDKSCMVKNKWFLCNSTHVVDLAFFLGGQPKEMTSYNANPLEWHPSGSSFGGSGITKKDTIFSYHANWNSPGRWGVEVFSENYRCILQPLEELYIQEKKSVMINTCKDINFILDKKFKPGLYLQVKNFIDDNTENFCSLKEQEVMFKYFYQIANYKLD